MLKACVEARDGPTALEVIRRQAAEPREFQKGLPCSGEEGGEHSGGPPDRRCWCLAAEALGRAGMVKEVRCISDFVGALLCRICSCVSCYVGLVFTYFDCCVLAAQACIGGSIDGGVTPSIGQGGCSPELPLSSCLQAFECQVAVGACFPGVS